MGVNALRRLETVCGRIAGATWFHGAALAVIVVAALIVGLETFPDVSVRYGALFERLDQIILALFTIELLVRLGAYATRPLDFFRDPWNVSDFVVVAIFFTPFVGAEAAVLRLARILRALRLVTALPGLQLLVLALIHTLPSIGYIGLLLSLLMYVYGVVGTVLFAASAPEHFGNLALAMVTLLQIVTFDDWARLMRDQPDQLVAALYFISFILIGTFIVLNLFIGVIVQGFDEAKRHHLARMKGRHPAADPLIAAGERTDELGRLADEVASLRREIERLRPHGTNAALAGEPNPRVPGQAPSGGTQHR